MSPRKRRRYHRSKPTITTVYVREKPTGARRVARIGEACAYGKVSRATLYRLIEKKIIKTYRYNTRLTLVDLDSIDAFHASTLDGQHAHG